jgi:hypothetical protein
VGRLGFSKNLGCERDRPPAPGRRLLDAELLAGVGAESFGGPGRGPDNVHGGVADAGQLLEARLYLGANIDVFWAALRSEGEVDSDVLFGFVRIFGGHVGELNGINEAEVNNVDGDLGIVATLQGA